ncbi:MAG: sugar ABC transporter permease [Firmicutes bacterium]|nr:sugar ABC transporter permease [Bacillota bacterium]
MKKMRNLLGQKIGYIFVLPWVIGFAVFTAYPVFYSLFLGFNQTTITADGIAREFIGIANFREAISTDIAFIRLIGSFSIVSVLSIPMIVILALVMALLLNYPLKARGIFRTIFFLPVIIASGPVIDKLMDMGVTTIPTLPDYAFYVFLQSADNIFASALLLILDTIIILLWMSGVQLLVFLAGLQKLDKQTVEAARVDGASAWEIFWKITLPSLSTLILVNLVYTTVMFAQTTLNPVIEHISANMFSVTTGFGYASALAWLYFLVISLIMLALVGIFALFSKKSLT